MKKNLFFLLLLLPLAALAQECVLFGQVVDKKGKALSGATVLLRLPRDSLVASAATTAADGRFRLPPVKLGTYYLTVTFLGYMPHFQNIIIPSSARTMDLRNIVLQEAPVILESVSVRGVREVVVKQDTMEYSADSYGTLSYAAANQLLEKLPGVEIDPDGTLKVQGENVTRIFVDGKELYGRDIKRAISSLPANAINKVQLIDGKPDDAKFSGVDDGRREKVINLTLKEASQTMSYGKITAGGGPDERYAAQGNYNQLHNDNLLSVTGAGNNVNNLGLSGAGTGGQALGGVGQPGRVTTHAAGVNGYVQAGEKTNINASYDFRQTDRQVLTSLTRQNFLPTGTSLYLENSRLQNRRDSHSGELGLVRSGTATTLRLSSTFDYSQGRLDSYNGRQSFGIDQTLVNEGERSINAGNIDLNISASAFLGVRLGKKGRMLTTSNDMSVNRTDTDGESRASTVFVNSPSTTLLQRNLDQYRELAYSSRVAYKEPIGKRQYLEASYFASNRESKSTIEAFDITNGTNLFDTEQSGVFNSRFLTQRVGLAYQLNTPKLTVSLGTMAQDALLSGSPQGGGAELRPRFRHLLPNATVKAQMSKASQLSLAYSTSIRPPTIGQLQPVVSRNDPLNISLGNPTLRPQYDHNGVLTFRSTLAFRLQVSAIVNLTYSTDPVVSAVSLDERLVRTTQFVNLAQNRSAGAVLSFSRSFPKLYSRLEIVPTLRLSEGNTLLNGVMGTNTQQAAGGSAKYNFRFKEVADINLRASLINTATRYHLTSTQHQQFISASYSADALLRFLKHYSLAATFNLLQVGSNANSSQQAAPLCNFYLSRRLLKADRCDLTLTLINALNRSAAATQTATQSYVEKTTQNFLGRFYLLSFTYNLRKEDSREKGE